MASPKSVSPSERMFDTSWIGIGTTGLGPGCNDILKEQKERLINDYIVTKDRERAQSQSSPRMDQKKKDQSLKEKIEQRKQLRREQLVAERKESEKEMREDKDRAVREKQEAAVKERNIMRERREKRLEQKEMFEKERKEHLRSEVIQQREFLDNEEKMYWKEIEIRHAIQKSIREQEKERAEKEKVAYSESIKDNGDHLRKKLRTLNDFHKDISEKNYMDKRKLIVEEKHDRKKRRDRLLASLEHQKELLYKSNTEEKEVLQKELKERRDRRLQETKTYIAQIKELRKANPNSWSEIRARQSKLGSLPSAIHPHMTMERAATSML